MEDEKNMPKPVYEDNGSSHELEFVDTVFNGIIIRGYCGQVGNIENQINFDKSIGMSDDAIQVHIDSLLK